MPAADRPAAERLAYLNAVQHEINTPMAVLRGWAETLTVAWDDLSDEERGHALRTIARSAETVTATLDAMFAELGAEALARTTHGGRCDLADAVRRAVEHPGRLEVALGDLAVGLAVPADPDRIEALIAVTMEGVGHVGGVAEVRIGASAVDDGAAVVFAGDGGGADLARVEDLFEPFPGGQPSPSGIRLLGARRLADAVGGRLEAAEDATVVLWLPLIGA